MLDLGQEPPFGDGGGHRVLVAGVQQALEHDPPVGDRAVHRQVDPAQPAVRQAARHLVLPVHHVPGAQLGHEGVGVAALGAEPLGAARAVAAGPAHRRAAVRAGAEPLALGHPRVVQHHGPRVGPRHRRHVDQARAQPPAVRAARPLAGAAHRQGADRRLPAQRPRQPAGDRAPGPRRRPRRRAGGRPRSRRTAAAGRTAGAGRAGRPGRGRAPRRPAGDPGGRRAHHAVRRHHRGQSAVVAVQLTAADVLVRAPALRPLALRLAHAPSLRTAPPPSAFTPAPPPAVPPPPGWA